MQRVRIGLTGLAFVFLAVLLAAVFTRSAVGDAGFGANATEAQKAAAGTGQSSDPLAQLGVAPGGESNQAAPPSPPPAPAR